MAIDEQPRSDAELQASQSTKQHEDRPDEQQQSADGGSADGQSGAAAATAVSPSLQEQIAQAIQPIVTDLRRQITQSLQEQMEQGQADQSQESEAPEQGGLQAALAQTSTALQQAFAKLQQMASTIVETVREWIGKAVAAIRQLAMSLVAQGIKTAAKPILKTAVNKGAEMVQDQGKQKLESMRQRLPAAGQADETPAATAAS